MSITQTVDIPESHRLVIDVPREVPAGTATIIYMPSADQRSADQSSSNHRFDDDGLDYEGECPLCAKYRDPKTGWLIPNAETAAAIEEGRAMMRGEIPSKRFNSVDEMWDDLMRDDPDD